MKKYFLIAVMVMFFQASGEAGIVVCHDNGNITSLRVRGEQVQGCLWFDANQNVNQVEYDRVKNLIMNLPRNYIKVVGSTIQEKTIQEKADADAVTFALQEQEEIQAVDQLRVSSEDIITALVQTINKRLSAGQKITKQEIIDQIKANKGL